MTSETRRPVVGWREWVSLPKLGVTRIKAKIDTGARTSALHAFDVNVFEKPDGTEWVRFSIDPSDIDNSASVVAEAPLHEMRRVTSSNGRSEMRPVIISIVSLLGRKWPIEITLARRDEMGFRLLLGRQAIRGRAVVDPGRSFIGGKESDRERT